MRNQSTLNALVGELQDNLGDDLMACKAVGVSLLFLNQWCKDDEKVREAVEEAKRVGRQGLISAALKRGVHGVEEDVWYKGEVVGQKLVYSDGLLQTLLKAQVPEFSKDGEGSQVQVNVNVANLMPRAETYDQWLAMKQQTLSGPKPAEPTTIEAEFTEVQTPFKGIDL